MEKSGLNAFTDLVDSSFVETINCNHTAKNIV